MELDPRFESLNLQAWGLAPCLGVKEAELMEYRQLFLKRGTLGNDNIRSNAEEKLEIHNDKGRF
eukprot:scaffold48141_cov49-Attheya_sp.AAC.2